MVAGQQLTLTEFSSPRRIHTGPKEEDDVPQELSNIYFLMQMLPFYFNIVQCFVSNAYTSVL